MKIYLLVAVLMALVIIVATLIKRIESTTLRNALYVIGIIVILAMPFYMPKVMDRINPERNTLDSSTFTCDNCKLEYDISEKTECPICHTTLCYDCSMPYTPLGENYPYAYIETHDYYIIYHEDLYPSLWENFISEDIQAFIIPTIKTRGTVKSVPPVITDNFGKQLIIACLQDKL